MDANGLLYKVVIKYMSEETMKDLRKKKLYVLMDVLCVFVGKLQTPSTELYVSVFPRYRKYSRSYVCVDSSFVRVRQRVGVFCAHGINLRTHLTMKSVRVKVA